VSKNILNDYANSILSVANELSEGRDMKKFMGRAGTRLKKKIIDEAKSKVDEKTGAYIKSIKRGAVWQKNGGISVNAYSDDPKSHLIEKGHRIVTKDGKEVGFQQGKYVFSDASEEYFKEFEEDVEGFLDGVLEDLF